MTGLWIAAGAAALYFVQVAFALRTSREQNLGWNTRSSWVPGAALYGLIVSFAVLAASALGPVVAVVAAVVVNLFVGAKLWMTARRTLRVRRLLTALVGPDAQRAIAALDQEVEGLRGGRGGEKADYDHRARWVLAIAAHASRAGHAARALDWTRRIEPQALGRQVAAMHAQHEAAFLISTGDRVAARVAAARAARPAAPPWEDALQATEALLEALEGDADAADAHARGGLERASMPELRLAWRMVRAHALARRGAIEEVKDVLRDLRDESGDDAVLRIVSHAGPASRLAEAMLVDSGVYR